MTPDRSSIEEAIRALTDWWMTGLCPDGFDAADLKRIQLVCDAAAAHVETMPTAPRMIEVWRVEVAYKMADGYVPRGEVYENKKDADRSALQWRNAGHACIKVTGPHLQEVPST